MIGIATLKNRLKDDEILFDEGYNDIEIENGLWNTEQKGVVV